MDRQSRKLLPYVVGVLLVLTVALCLAWPILSAGAQGETRVIVDPSSAEVAVGETVTVTIRIEDVTDMDFADVTLTFDQALLEVVDDDSGEDGVQIEPGDWMSPGYIDANLVDQDDGEIAFAQVADNPVTGTGVLATITFKGKAAGTSKLEFYDVVLEHPDTTSISALEEDGSVTVTGEETGSPTPSPTATSSTSPLSTPTPSATASPTSSPGPTSSPAPTSASPTSSPTATPQPTATAGAIESRVLQIWPDRSIGIVSRLLEGMTTHADTQKLPFGFFSPSAAEVVRARTYLHFPLSVFRPGTQVLKATLYVYVDSSSGTGGAEFGAYRVLDPWGEVGWESDPATWAELLPSPIAITPARFETMTAALPAFTALAGTGAPFKPTGRGLMAQSDGGMHIQPAVGVAGESSSSPLPTPKSSSPLPTPTLSPTATPAGASTPTRTPTATPTGTPAPTSPAGSATSTPPSEPAALAIALGQVEGTWLEWDVTALMRAWVAGDVPDYGLALALAPNPDTDPEAAGNLLLARLLTAEDPETRPYVIADIKIYPVTPTPTPAPILPSAGGPARWGAAGFLLVGMALLVLGLAVRRRD